MSPAAIADTTDWTEEFGARWNRFWFNPADPLPTCLLRVCVGILAACHFAEQTRDLNVWYASGGILSPTAVTRLLELTGGDPAYHVSYLNRLPASGVLFVVHVAAIVFALAFAAGFLTRITGVLTLVCTLAYVHRTPQAAVHIEPVLSFLLAYLCIAPSGACLSLDRCLFGSVKRNALLAALIGSSEPSVAANIGLRLIQVHLAMFYAMMGLTKLYGDAWWQGVALWLLIAQTESRPLDLTWIRRLGDFGEYLLNFLTHAIVYFELALPILIWTRMGRPILLTLSVFLWTVLIIATGQLLFGLLMIAAGIAFISPSYCRGLLGRDAVTEPALQS